MGALGGALSPIRQAFHLSFTRSGYRLLRTARRAACTSRSLTCVPISPRALITEVVKLWCLARSCSIARFGFWLRRAITQLDFSRSFLAAAASDLVRMEGLVHKTIYISSHERKRSRLRVRSASRSPRSSSSLSAVCSVGCIMVFSSPRTRPGSRSRKTCIACPGLSKRVPSFIVACSMICLYSASPII